MCDRKHLAVDKAERKCNFCEGRRSDITQWAGATDIDEDGYRVVVISVCDECRRDPDMVGVKLRKWADRLRSEAAVLESFSPREAGND